jgi:crotonobetainyl-CoA:carnitine CoA-transferase CaiB-like acyl-CoA transferase
MRGLAGTAHPVTAAVVSTKMTADKESLCPDLKSVEGQQIVCRLIAKADVISTTTVRACWNS